MKRLSCLFLELSISPFRGAGGQLTQTAGRDTWEKRGGYRTCFRGPEGGLGGSERRRKAAIVLRPPTPGPIAPFPCILSPVIHSTGHGRGTFHVQGRPAFPPTSSSLKMLPDLPHTDDGIQLTTPRGTVSLKPMMVCGCQAPHTSSLRQPSLHIPGDGVQGPRRGQTRRGSAPWTRVKGNVPPTPSSRGSREPLYQQGPQGLRFLCVFGRREASGGDISKCNYMYRHAHVGYQQMMCNVFSKGPLPGRSPHTRSHGTLIGLCGQVHGLLWGPA